MVPKKYDRFMEPEELLGYFQRVIHCFKKASGRKMFMEGVYLADRMFIYTIPEQRYEIDRCLARCVSLWEKLEDTDIEKVKELHKRFRSWARTATYESGGFHNGWRTEHYAIPKDWWEQPCPCCWGNGEVSLEVARRNR